MRRWHGRYKEFGVTAYLIGDWEGPVPNRCPLALVDQVFRLYREKCCDLRGIFTRSLKNNTRFG